MADAWYTLGVAAEALDDDAGMRAAWKRTWQLDAASGDDDAVARLEESEVLAIAEQALGELPEKARRLLVDVPIIIADLPAEADVEAGLDPRMLGLFNGTPYPEASHLGGQPGTDPDRAFPPQPGARGGERGGSARGDPDDAAARDRALLWDG